MICQADARRIPLADESVQCVVTSPPYWGLRDYGLATWEGGNVGCDHAKEPPRFNGPKQTMAQVSGHASQAEANDRRVCAKCGAIRHDAGIGLESTPEEYVAHIVEAFREVWPILRPDGTLWLNLGDCYGGYFGDKYAHRPFGKDRTADATTPPNKPSQGRMAKQLMGIPWRVAFALQADGWYLRSDIIWHKPNPMPESVTDRPTKSHEHLFLLSKSAHYFYDAEAVKEPVSAVSLKRAEYGWDCDRPSTKNASMGGKGIHTEKMGERFVNPSGRNRRDVWTIPTAPYKGAHFATFPPALVEPCILAGTRQGDIVLDPFCGSGTVGQVCMKHGRRFVGLDLSRPYLKLAEERLLKAPIGLL